MMGGAVLAAVLFLAGLLCAPFQWLVNLIIGDVHD